MDADLQSVAAARRAADTAFEAYQQFLGTDPAHIDAIVDAMADKPLGDPEVPGMVAEAYQYLDAEMPFIPLVQSAKLIPFSTTYWTGWPSEENNYNRPFFWWNHTHQIIHNLEKAGG